MTDAKIKVHSYRRCPFAIRVRMTLHEKGIPFVNIEESLKNPSEELRQLHPEVKVPVLIDGDQVIYESAIITEYLDEAYGEGSLTPPSPASKAVMRLWTHWCNHIFKPHVDHYKYGESRSRKEDVAMAIPHLNEDLSKIDTALGKDAYLMGDSLGLADIHVFPFFRQLYRSRPSFPDIDQYKNVVGWYERLSQRPSFLRAMEKANHA